MSGATQPDCASLDLGLLGIGSGAKPMSVQDDFSEPSQLIALTTIAVIGDLLAVLSAFWLSCIVCGFLVPDFNPPRIWFGALVLIIMIASIAEQGDYGASVLLARRIRPWLLAKACLQTIGAVILVVFPAIVTTKHWIGASPDSFRVSGMAPSTLVVLELILLGVAYLTILVVRLISRVALAAPLARPRRIVLVGEPGRCSTLVHNLDCIARQSMKIVGVVNHSPAPAGSATVPAERSGDLPLLNSTSELVDMANGGKVDIVIVALPWSEHVCIRELTRLLASAPVDVFLTADFDSLALPAPSNTAPASVSLMRAIYPPLVGWRAFVKRAEDIVIAGTIALLTAPAFLAIAILVRLTSPGPTFFRQKRIGYQGRVFEALKFRTMYVHMTDATGAAQTTRGDPRITRFGAWLRRRSLDELPQILNVLRGDMSLVGPRPHPIGMTARDGMPLEQATPDYSLRHRVRPGLTGWAQVNGNRGPIHTRDEIVDRVTLDLEYIRDWSLSFDLRIIYMTIGLLFDDENAF